MNQELTPGWTLFKKAWQIALGKRYIRNYLILGGFPLLLNIPIILIGAMTVVVSAVYQDVTDQFLQSLGSNIPALLGLISVVIVLVIISVVIGTWYLAVSYKIYHDTERDTLLPVRSYVTPGRAAIGRLLTTTMISGLVSLAGSLFLIIPGIIFTMWFSFAPFIAVTEDHTANWSALMESKRLVRGRFWKLFRRMLLGGVIQVIGNLILSAIPMGNFVSPLFAPIFGLYFYLVYADFKRTAPATA